MEDALKHINAGQFTRNVMHHLLNLADCVKKTSRTFEVSHFRVHSLAYGALSSPKADKTIGTLYHFKNT